MRRLLFQLVQYSTRPTEAFGVLLASMSVTCFEAAVGEGYSNDPVSELVALDYGRPRRSLNLEVLLEGDDLEGDDLECNLVPLGGHLTVVVAGLRLWVAEATVFPGRQL